MTSYSVYIHRHTAVLLNKYTCLQSNIDYQTSVTALLQQAGHASNLERGEGGSSSAASFEYH
jgi:hypothetical protein